MITRWFWRYFFLFYPKQKHRCGGALLISHSFCELDRSGKLSAEFVRAVCAPWFLRQFQTSFVLFHNGSCTCLQWLIWRPFTSKWLESAELELREALNTHTCHIVIIHSRLNIEKFPFSGSGSCIFQSRLCRGLPAGHQTASGNCFMYYLSL